MEVVVYTQYYRARTPSRQLEIVECLRRNLNHPSISKLVLFKEKDAPPLPQGTVPLQVVECEDRITYSVWLRWVQRQGSGIGLLLNADIYLDQGLEYLPSCLDAPDIFLALTRYNPGATGIHLNDFPHWTQDVWGVRSDAPLSDSLLHASGFPLGFPGCDNRIAHVMWSHGFRLRNPCHHIRTVHLQADSARAYDNTRDRLYGGVSYVHPSLAPDEDAELEFTVWTRSPERPAGILINQMAIDRGQHPLIAEDPAVAKRFLDQQRHTAWSWGHEVLTSAPVDGDADSFAQDSAFLPLPALLGDGLELRLCRPTRLEGLSLRLPKRAGMGYRLELSLEGEPDGGPAPRWQGSIPLGSAGQRSFWEPPEPWDSLWSLVRLRLAGPPAQPAWRPEEGVEVVLFGAPRFPSQVGSPPRMAEHLHESTPSQGQPRLAFPGTAAEGAAYAWRRRSACVETIEQGDELHRYGNRFRVLRCGDSLIFEDRFWPSVGVSSLADLPCEPEDARALLLWGFGQPSLLLRPNFIANSKRFADDVHFWQYPCRTEGDAAAVHQSLVGPRLKDGVLEIYLGLPWATWIDRRTWPAATTLAIADRLRALRQQLQEWGLGLRVHSVCQHILWRDVLHAIREAGVDCLWLSHKPATINQLDGVQLKAWHLYPVNAREQDRATNLVIRPIHLRPWLASFIGAHMNHYLSDIRLRLLALKDLHRFHIHVQDEWHSIPSCTGSRLVKRVSSCVRAPLWWRKTTIVTTGY